MTILTFGNLSLADISIPPSHHQHNINNQVKDLASVLHWKLETYPDSLFPWTERIFMCRHDPISGGSSSRSFSSTFRVWSRLSQPERRRLFDCSKLDIIDTDLCWVGGTSRNSLQRTIPPEKSSGPDYPAISLFDCRPAWGWRSWSEIQRTQVLAATCLVSQPLKNAQPWEQLGWIVIFRVLKTKERH